MNKSIILTSEQCEESLDAINEKIDDWKEDGDLDLIEPIEILSGMVESINSQLNSDSIQEAWQKLTGTSEVNYEIGMVNTETMETIFPPTVELSDVLNFLKTIGINID